jgi:hypothetical protein
MILQNSLVAFGSCWSADRSETNRRPEVNRIWPKQNLSIALLRDRPEPRDTRILCVSLHIDSRAWEGDVAGRVTHAVHQRLQELRNELLNLHKALVDSERVSYEKTVGGISSPNHFLRLLTTDPWFAWLQPVSQLIVAMDEALEAKQPATDADAEALIKQTRLLLVASEDGEGFSRHYFDALQRDPDVVLAHAVAAKLFNVRKPRI